MGRYKIGVDVTGTDAAGVQRFEHMLPFRAPFNDSAIYAEPRLMQILSDFFTQEQFKMELMTVITSQPGKAIQGPQRCNMRVNMRRCFVKAI